MKNDIIELFDFLTDYRYDTETTKSGLLLACHAEMVPLEADSVKYRVLSLLAEEILRSYNEPTPARIMPACAEEAK